MYIDNGLMGWYIVPYFKDCYLPYLKDYIGPYFKYCVGPYFKDYSDSYFKDYIGPYFKDGIGPYFKDCWSFCVRYFIAEIIKMYILVKTLRLFIIIIMYLLAFK